MKKLSVIAQENGKTPAALKKADNRDQNLLTYYSRGIQYINSLKNGKPSGSEIGKYFFLPALGYYLNGTFYLLGSYGFYWSSSATPETGDGVFALHFNSKKVELYGTTRAEGFVAQPFE